MPTTNKNEEERKEKIERVNRNPKYLKPPTQTLNKRIEPKLDFRMNKFGFEFLRYLESTPLIDSIF
jgi:hypothetical protein